MYQSKLIEEFPRTGRIFSLANRNWPVEPSSDRVAKQLSQR
jgi:hypothetical protein